MTLSVKPNEGLVQLKLSNQKTRDKFRRKIYTVNAGPYSLNLGLKTNIMGIVNVTPDSFSQDGTFNKSNPLERSVRLANKMIKQGADIIDIGGESSRPGAKKVTSKEEMLRVVPVIKKLAKAVKVPISVDTYKPSVAKHALDSGASMVNNIFGAKPNISLLKMVKNYGAAIVLMHMQGAPKTMQKRAHYQNLMKEIIGALKKSLEICLEIGIKSDRIIIDPGIGFGKTVEHNLEIIDRLEELQYINKPLLLGTSRKSFIGHILCKDVNERLYGSLASASLCILRGAHIVRVHDVKETLDVAMLCDATINTT